ncbi:putative porin [Pseudoduganella lurida]|uniref:Putative porin n=1 Tax=Pseudoduganella lurida TaxID=1036180 RepID=A0A562QY96_9BURK|nr:porin [Pseudoduganella lurida]TWI61160.1 putative porin [Pseudoduganella lurida]
MKHTLIAAAAAACTLAALPARAQSGVSIYGIVDAAVEHYTNADAAGNGVSRVPTLGGGLFPSRIGFRGTEDLGGGLKVIFTLENGFGVDNGVLNQGGRLFGRQAWVGLAGSWGQVTVGRNYNMIYVSSFDVDTFGPSQYGLGALDPAVPNGRSDNSIAYKGTFNGVTVGATYSLGRDTSSAGGASGTACAGESASDSSACREWSALLRYDRPAWAVVAAYDRIHGGSGAANGLTSSDRTDSRLHVAGLVKGADWKLGGGVLLRDNQGSATQPKSRLYYLGAAYNVTPLLVVDGQLAKLDYRATGNDTKQALLRATYYLSTRTAVYLAGGRLDNDGIAAVAMSAGGSVGAGLAQTGIITGIKHSF